MGVTLSGGANGIASGTREVVAVLGSAAPRAWPLSANAQQAKTSTWRLLGLSGAALVASTIGCSAGSCAPEIERMQVRLAVRLEAAAAAGPSVPEGSNALLHHQPTPRSMAATELRLGEISPEKAKIIREAMARARDADQAGDKTACEQALAEIQRMIGP
jgi:hypothetical protein